MAIFDYTRSYTDTGSFVGRTLSRIQSVITALIAWNDARVTRNALSALSDRELDDLGLVRGDIEDIAQGTFRR